MLILADQQITGEILGKPFFGRTSPPAGGGTLPSGLYLLNPPDKDPVFGAYVLAVRPGPGTAAGIWIKKSAQSASTYEGIKQSGRAYEGIKQSGRAYEGIKQTARAEDLIKGRTVSSRMVEWKMPGSPGGEAAHFGDHIKPGTGEAIKVQPPGDVAQFPKMQPPGGSAQFPKMQPPADAAQFPKMQPPGGSAQFPKMQPPADAAQFPKMQPPGGSAQFPKMQPPADAAQFPKMQPPGSSAQFPKMQRTPQHTDGAPSAVVLSQRAIPGRYCLVVVSGFADLLRAVQAAGGAQLLIR